MINLQNKMAVKVTKKVKYTIALYLKINVTRSTFCMESFMLFQKVHTCRTMPPYYVQLSPGHIFELRMSESTQ